MTDFDDILKKGKQAVGPVANKKTDWKQAIGAVLGALQQLNELYGDDKHHYIHSIDRVKCYKCGSITYLLNVYDIDDRGLQLKFHLSDWQVITPSTYYCPKCKTP